MACLTRRNPLPSKVSHDPTQLMALRQTVSMEQYISVTPGAYHIQRGKNLLQCNPRVACSLYITVHVYIQSSLFGIRRSSHC